MMDGQDNRLLLERYLAGLLDCCKASISPATRRTWGARATPSVVPDELVGTPMIPRRSVLEFFCFTFSCSD
jgi:hypothetical protein